MKHSDEVRLLVTKYECGAVDGFALAEGLRRAANRVEEDAILSLAEHLIALGDVFPARRETQWTSN
ncbi:MAG: hypothetical protein AB1696_19270 [Planctomycetota bacterium]